MVTEEAVAVSKVCPACAEEVRAEAKVCRFCNHRFGAAESPKSECGTAVMGLLLPGVGHFYAGENRRGLVVLGAALLAVVGFFGFRVGVIAVPVVGIVSAVDAFRAAKIYNAGGEPRSPSGGIWALVVLGVVCLIAGVAIAAS